MNPNPTKKIIEGFEEDLRQIMTDFPQRSKDIRLEQFLVYWNDIHMDCLFANRFDPRELLEAIVEMNKQLVILLLDSTDLTIESRAVVLYFLLCLFQKQPPRLRRKIRLTCEDAVSIDKLCKEFAALKGHSDAIFSWNKLKRDEAIDFVEERHIFGPSMLCNKTSGAYESSTPRLDLIREYNKESLEFITRKLEPPLNELSSLIEKYEEIRCVLDRSEYHETIELDRMRPLKEYCDRVKSIIDHYKEDINR